MRSILGLMFGVVLLWFAFGWQTEPSNELQDLHDSGEKVVGTVTGERESERTRSTGSRRNRHLEKYTVLCPEITYRVDGEVQDFVEFADCDRLAIGDEVTVMYDPETPYSARLDSDVVVDGEKDSNQSRWLLVGLGALFVTGSGIGLLLRIRRFVAS